MSTPFTLTRAQVRDLDRRATEEYGIPGIVLMENAGRGCAELLMKLNPEKKPTMILCGPGNNGGDGFVMARHLDNAGWEVDVRVFAANNGVSADAAVNLEIVTESDIQFTQCDPDYFLHPDIYDQFLRLSFNPAGWVVDALFGTGLSRPLGEPFGELATLINACEKPTLAIDIPSGLDCDTGEPLGPTVRATHTATFVAPKRGFLNPASKTWTGEVRVIDIGAPRKLVEEYRTGERRA
jgi:NAD(P)H-hydrate epimerase